jgi:hypothetical protein
MMKDRWVGIVDAVHLEFGGKLSKSDRVNSIVVYEVIHDERLVRSRIHLEW